ncbi:MAG: hydrogenase accessory protein HypB [Thermoplasmata archaeon HGW-Thermoplasmata-1]|nr:MAG: hydrogenase accessory protein HypB [Thermoplasmata archaeon HGW-Thermoplasmata-1]
MHKIIDVEFEADVLDANRRIADDVGEHLDSHGILSVEFMGSTGSGKTLIIEKLVDHLAKNGKRAGVIVGDVAGDDDYRRIKAHGAEVVNVNTGKECHLDAHLVEHASEKIDLDAIDCLIVENVGNLICPADFPLGTKKRVVVISVTEGDDMVRKHPVIFQIADAIVVNKIDLAPYVDVDLKVIQTDLKRIAPHVPAFMTDAKHGENLETFMDAILDE